MLVVVLKIVLNLIIVDVVGLCSLFLIHVSNSKQNFQLVHLRYVVAVFVALVVAVLEEVVAPVVAKTLGLYDPT